MHVSGQFHVSASLPLGKHSSNRLTGGWAGPGAGLDAVAKRRNPCPRLELKPGRSVRSSVITLTELSRLLTKGHKKTKDSRD
jgi:hypothetical protein